MKHVENEIISQFHLIFNFTNNVSYVFVAQVTYVIDNCRVDEILTGVRIVPTVLIGALKPLTSYLNMIFT